MNNKPQNTDLNIKKIAELFHTTEEKIVNLLDKRTLHTTPAGNLILEKSTSHIESGTAIFPDEGYQMIHGFPKIKRAMVLQPTLQAHFTCPEIAVEEKMNGYNTRIILLDNQITALTRKGHTCPYTTEKAQGLLTREIFTDHPEWVLCGEMVGPDSPHVPSNTYNIESLEFYLFDIREKTTNTPLPISDKYKVAEEYNIKTAKLFGIYTLNEAYEKITNIIKTIGLEGREGVVIKDPGMKQPPLKYTSSQSNCSDLKYAFTYFNDYARSFFYSRIVREAFQSVEWGETPEELGQRCNLLGENILLPMTRTIKKIRENEKLTEDLQIRVKKLETARKFKEHLRLLGIDAVFHSPQKIDGEYLVKIQKINQSTQDKTESLLQGHTW